MPTRPDGWALRSLFARLTPDRGGSKLIIERCSIMSSSQTSKGEATQSHILKSAVTLFRKRGFHQTSMRDIAREAGMSLGAAYHYFPSKESLVLAYYGWTQLAHEDRADKAVASATTVSERLRALLTTKLQVLGRDRRILGALFSSLADPAHPLSLFGKDTKDLRGRSVGLFRDAFRNAPLSDEVQGLLGYLAWMAHLAVLLYFVHDTSKKQTRTHLLASAVAEAFGTSVSFATTPLARPFMDRGLKLAYDLGWRGPL